MFCLQPEGPAACQISAGSWGYRLAQSALTPGEQQHPSSKEQHTSRADAMSDAEEATYLLVLRLNVPQ